MKKAQRIKKTKTYSWHYLFVIILVFIISIIASYFYLKPRFVFQAPFIENIESQRAETRFPATGEAPPRLYKSPEKDLLEDKDELITRAALLSNAEDTIKKYMEPHGTKLLDLYMDKDGIIYADFSNELRNKFNGDASDEYQIIVGLYKNIKTNIPNFNSLKILMDGKEVESLGGHIDISKSIGEPIEKSTGE